MEPEHGKEIRGLEIARFLCALAVVFWHYANFFVDGVSIDDINSNYVKAQLPLYQLFRFFYENGYSAVMVFWMISGFIFAWKYGSRIGQGYVSAYQFLILRWSRLYPLHFTTLVTVGLLQYIYIQTHGKYFCFGYNDLSHFILQLFFVSNWVNALPQTFDGPIWSVSVEVLVYAFFFLAVVYMNSKLVLYGAVAVAALAINHYLKEHVVQCVAFFFVGGAIQKLTFMLRRRHKQVVFWLCAAGLVMLSSSGSTLGSMGLRMGFSICMVTAFSLLDVAAPLPLRHVAKLGDLTYASYLLHFPLQLVAVLIVDTLGLGRSLFLSPGALAAFLVCTFGLSWVVYHAFELPAQGVIRLVCLRPPAGPGLRPPDQANPATASRPICNTNGHED